MDRISTVDQSNPLVGIRGQPRQAAQALLQGQPQLPSLPAASQEKLVAHPGSWGRQLHGRSEQRDAYLLLNDRIQVKLFHAVRSAPQLVFVDLDTAGPH